MASLTGNKIKDTYPGLIKTNDNAIVGATEKQITDGEGNVIPMTMGTSGVSFTGNADFTAATVTGLPSGGNTVAAIRAQLPQVAITTFTVGGTGQELAWRANVFSSGYGITNMNDAADLGNIGFSIFAMSPGEILNTIRFNVSTVGSANSFINLAIYDLTWRVGGGAGQYSSGIVCNDLVKDLGQIATDTNGVKTIDISANPYVMPNNSDWGAIAIAWATGGDTAPLVSGWSQAIWDGNAAFLTGTTAYRNVQPFYTDIATPTLPSNLSDPTLKIEAQTNAPVWMFIQTAF